MVEAFLFGAPVLVVMLGVPIWHSLGECRKGRSTQLRLLRWWLTCGFIVSVSMLSGLAFGLAGFVLSNLPPSPSPKPSQVSTDCKILSAGIDLRWSKTCTPQYLLKPEGSLKVRSKFRCYFDYYWASVFKVELRPYSSDLLVEAVSEVPRAALPAHCRPDFGPLWILKEKYQVNGTYPCKYSPGSSGVVDIVEDLFAKCKAEKVTILNLIRQALMVIFFSEQWILSSTSQGGRAVRKALHSILFAVCYSVLTAGFARTTCKIRSLLYGSDSFSVVEKVYFEVRLQITCMLMATLVGASWYNGHLEGLMFLLDRLLSTLPR